MDVFQGLPSNSVPLCLTSWENQQKSAKTSYKNCRPPHVRLILGSNFQMPEGTTFICTIVHKYKHHGTMQPSYRSGRGRVLSPRDECTLVRKVQINPRTTAKDLVKMLEETGTKVSTQQGRSHCSKTAIKKPDYGLQLHMGTKIILFGEMSSGLMKQK